MEIRTVIVLVCGLVVGLIGGWLSKGYLDTRADRALSVLALSQANEVRSRDIQKAIFYATQATLANPSSYLAQLSLAEMYEQAGHKQMALDSYREALRLLRAERGGQHEESTVKKKIEQLGALNTQ